MMRNWLSVILCLAAAGCDFGPRRLHVPKFTPDEIAQHLIDQCDSDSDGRLAETESRSCPSLEAAFDRYDSDRDGHVSAEEIAARLQAMRDSGIGRMPCVCTIYWNGLPLAGANVELVPEECFGESIQPATGKTNDRGVAKPVTVDAPPGVPGVQFGLYRVRVSHPQREIPARYNRDSTLGMELSPLEREGDTATFHLPSD